MGQQQFEQNKPIEEIAKLVDQLNNYERNNFSDYDNLITIISLSMKLNEALVKESRVLLGKAPANWIREHTLGKVRISTLNKIALKKLIVEVYEFNTDLLIRMYGCTVEFKPVDFKRFIPEMSADVYEVITLFYENMCLYYKLTPEQRIEAEKEVSFFHDINVDNLSDAELAAAFKDVTKANNTLKEKYFK